MPSVPGSSAPLFFLGGRVPGYWRHHLHSGYVPVRSNKHDRGVAPRPRGSRLRPNKKETKEKKGSRELKRRAAHAPDAAQVCIKKDPCTGMCIKMVCAIPAWAELVAILAEGAIALSVTHSGGVLFAS